MGRPRVASWLALLCAAACEQGSDVRTDVPATIEGANAHLGEADINGLKVSAVDCRSGEGSLAAVDVVGAMAKHKFALAACAKVPENARVHFAYSGGLSSDIRVSASSPEAARCIGMVMLGVAPPGTGVCIVTLPLGAK